MRTTTLLLILAALAACSSGPQEIPLKEIYEDVNLLKERYNAALNAQDSQEQFRIELAIRSVATHNYEALVKGSAEPEDPQGRIAATFALAFSKRTEAETPLRARLEDSEPEARAYAAIGLGLVGASEPAIERVKKILDDHEVFVRQAALYALRVMLGSGRDAGLAPRLIIMIGDQDVNIRNEVVLLMGRIQKAEFLEPLARKGLRDPIALVRCNTAQMIGKYGDGAESVLPHLIEVLRDDEAAVVEAAQWALRKITGHEFDRSYDTWRNWYEEERDKYEYFCQRDADVMRSMAGLCPKCGAKLERRLKPFVPKREEKKVETNEPPKDEK